MKITNRLNLPAPIVEAIKNIQARRDTDGADITVSALDKPARLLTLERLHDADLEQDASDMIPILLGQAMHMVLEQANIDGLAEQRLSMDVCGWKVSGQFDHFALDETAMLSDYKHTKVFTIQVGRAEWTANTNCYAHLLRHHGYTVKALQVVAFAGDWLKSMTGRANYPPHQVSVIPLELWSPAACQHYLETRVQAHQQARVTLPLCTDEERWERGKGPVRCNSWCLVRQQCEAVQDTQWRPF